MRMAAGVAVAAVAAVGLAACSGSGPATSSPTHIADPRRGLAAKPDYSEACSPSGLDRSLPCIQVTLAAVDQARAKEGVKPMLLPADFADLSVPQQLLVALDRERVDRGLPPFVGLSAALDSNAQAGADAGDVPAEPGAPFVSTDAEWIGAVANGLDAAYVWMYDDGPGSGVPRCAKAGDDGCWADRHIVLDTFDAGSLVMGAAVNPTADSDPDDRGGSSLAATFGTRPGPPTDLVYTWAQALADTAAGTVTPRADAPTNGSATHIPDPARTVPPLPDYISACSDGIDTSDGCLGATLQAVNNARAAEGVKPMVLPPGFGRLTVAQQILVTTNLERVDRNLPPFEGLTAALDGNAQVGADIANDPPDPGQAYSVVDTIWAGGSANGLDADYGWMYDDGPGSTNLDCPKSGGSGCWGHRHGILDDFGTVGTLVMGAALNATADTNQGDTGGTSMAATLAVVADPPPAYAFTWAQGQAGVPG
ncbi:MAG: hypothetical protein ABR511_13475 [Acidimicrobiales bacterium]